MTSWVRAILWGLVVWLVPFVVAVSVFPLKENNRPLFESIMPVTLSLVAVACGLLYFRRVQRTSLREGVLLGCLWFVISVLIDLPLMLSPPISFTPLEYAADVGFTYLMFPVITVGIAFAAKQGAGAKLAEDATCVPPLGSTAAPNGPPTPPDGR